MRRYSILTTLGVSRLPSAETQPWRIREERPVAVGTQNMVCCVIQGVPDGDCITHAQQCQGP